MTATDFLPLKPNDFYILFVLAEGDLHGYAIAREIRDATEGQLQLEAGNLHRTIQKMIRQGLVAPAKRRPAADAQAERRRYYRITPAGRRALTADVRRMRSAVEAAQSRHLLDSEPTG